MRVSHTTKRSFRCRAVAVLATLGLGYTAAQAEGVAEAVDPETYDWSATLVSFDRDSGTAVLQARIESYADIAGLDTFADGDRLTLVWTGRLWAADVRDLARDPDVSAWALTLPVEFVATAHDDNYLNFRVAVPTSAFAALGAMDPGARVTGISPKSGATWDTAVSELRHYNDID